MLPVEHGSALHAAGLHSTPAAFYPGSHLIEVWPQDGELPFESFAFLVHERSHYLEAIATTFGTYYADSLNYRGSAIATAGGRIARATGRLRSTFRDWRSEREAQACIDSDRTTFRLNRLMFCVDRLDVALGRFLGYDTVYDASDPHLQGISWSGSHYASVAPPCHGVHPTIDTQVGQISVAGAQLMESFALYWQVYAQHFALDRRAFDHTILTRTMARLAHADPIAYRLYASPIEHVVRVLGPLQLWAFPLLADIAMSGPLPMVEEAMEPEAVALMETEGTLGVRRLGDAPTSKWEDVHPGWRFFRAVEVLSGSEALERYRGMTSSWEEAAEDAMTWICKKLSWKTPVQVASQRLEADALEPRRKATVPAIQTRRTAALRARCKRPCLFAFPGYFPEEVSEHFTPPVFLCGALPTPTANVVHVDAKSLYLLFYVHLINHWADLLLPSLANPPGPATRVQTHDCPFASENYQCVCGMQSRAACRAGRFLSRDCFYRQEFCQEFGVQPEAVTFIGTAKSIDEDRH